MRGRLGKALALGLLLAALGSCRQAEWKEAEHRSAILGRNVPAESLRVEIEKGARILTLWSSSQKLKSYPVVLGRDPDGRKLYEGDYRTPEGEYVISSKYKHPHWQWFMGVSYPNASDRAAYEAAKKENRIPTVKGRVAGIGGSVGIHGTYSDSLNKAKVDWTFGCISLQSSDIKELAEVVKVGTKVEIKP